MKKNCLGCKAYEDRQCSLGYQNEPIYNKNLFIVDARPLEECPKPLTTKALMREYVKKREQK